MFILQNVKYYISFLLLFFAIQAKAQFAVTGDASDLSCNEFELTANASALNGSFYNSTPVNLTSSFSLLFSVKFGCENSGGEGLSFIMQTGPWSTGSGGYGLGYQGMPGNSISVEFDTRDNEASGEISNSDGPADHISLMTNGSIDHGSANCITGLPLTNISSISADVEDCEFHLVEVNWTAGATQTLEVKVDGVSRITRTEDFITTRFGGSSSVLWGWSASTSIFTNQQIVKMALESDYSFTPTNCPGDAISFTDLSLSYYPITDWEWDFDGLGSSTIPNPTFTFMDAGSHPVELIITDSFGCEDTLTIDIGVGFETDVTASDAIVCVGETVDLNAEASPFTGSDCCFQLILGDLWDDGWAGNEVEVYADGTLYGTYAPAAAGAGGAYEEIIDLCFDHGTELEFIINGDEYPGECYFKFLDETGTTLVEVTSGVATWVDGHSETYTVDCGITPPAYTFLWDNAGILSPGATVSNPTATMATGTWFHVDITDPDNGCVITDSVFVDTYPEVTATISGFETVCEGNTGDLTIALTGTAPWDINVTGPSGALPAITGIMTSPYTLSVGEDGVYTITAVSGDGCSGTFSGSGEIDVIVPPAVDVGTDAEYCDGDPLADLTVITSSGGTITWYGDAGLTTVLGTGSTFTPASVVGTTSYYATETEGVLGCEGTSDMVTITINPIPPAPIWTGPTEYCQDEIPTPLTAETTYGGIITWYDAAPPATVLSTLLTYNPPTSVPGSFDYFITETAAGCEGPATVVTVLIKPTPDPPILTGDDQYCEGDVFTALTATPGLGGDISWENDAGVLLGTGTSYTPSPGIGATDYYIYETLDGCISDPTLFTINVDAAPFVDVVDQVEVCLGDSILVTANHNGYDLTWSDGTLGESNYLIADTTTWFDITANNPSCGFDIDSVLLVVNKLPIVIAGADTTIGIGGEVELWAWSNVPVVWSWSQDYESCVYDDCSRIYDVPDQATIYIAYARDENNCVSSDTVLVDIEGYMEVYVPNIFSPNDDGFNDVLVVKGPRLFNYYIEIYDRWGKKVFVSTEQKDYWDGKFEGQTLAPQTFVYVLSGETVLGEKISKQGNVTIIK